MACCPFSAKPLSEPMLTHWWLNQSRLYLNKIITIFKQENAFENVFCKIAAIFTEWMCQWVSAKKIHSHSNCISLSLFHVTIVNACVNKQCKVIHLFSKLSKFKIKKLSTSLWVAGTHWPWSLWAPEHWEWVPSLMFISIANFKMCPQDADS